jgi:hypothetical protein
LIKRTECAKEKEISTAKFQILHEHCFALRAVHTRNAMTMAQKFLPADFIGYFMAIRAKYFH